MQEQTTSASVTLGSLNAAGMTAKAQISPLQQALNTQNEQLDKLGALFTQLEDRLALVRNMDLTVPANNEAPQSLPSTSPAVNQVMLSLDMIRTLQHRVDNLLQELEV